MYNGLLAFPSKQTCLLLSAGNLHLELELLLSHCDRQDGEIEFERSAGAANFATGYMHRVQKTEFHGSCQSVS
jgi:hypothetical protein